jgi:hypothetical protein
VALEIRIVSPEWEQPLADFFAALRMSGERYFHSQLIEAYFNPTFVSAVDEERGNR